MPSHAPFEPLEESAALAWTAAPDLCLADAVGGDVCRWYHQTWQYLRLLGLITSIRTNADFLDETFRGLAARGDCRRVLIAGTADYGMLAHLVHAYAGSPLDVTVLDRCETPLMLNRWYANRCGLGIETRCADVFAPGTDHDCDLICTHNFLGHIPADRRRELAARWHDQLRPGGFVVTTQRVEPELPPETNEDAEVRARALADRVRAAVGGRAWRGPDGEALARAAYAGWRRRAARHRVRSIDDVADLFARAGFDIVRADDGGGPAEQARDRGSGGHGARSYRMRLVARRR